MYFNRVTALTDVVQSTIPTVLSIITTQSRWRRHASLSQPPDVDLKAVVEGTQYRFREYLRHTRLYASFHRDTQQFNRTYLTRPMGQTRLSLLVSAKPSP